MGWPKVILHVDGDAFFASCEVSLNPSLKGKPVVVGLEKGIASAFSYEAKARGVFRGMIISEIRKICPEAIILAGDYHTYSVFSERMFAIVRRHTPYVEEYSIDECFADLSFLLEKGWGTVETVIHAIKNDLERELGMTFSCGVAPTKVLAKVASKWKKPNGLTFVSLGTKEKFLKEVPVGKIWGIGPSSSLYLQKQNIKTALDFITCAETWIQENLSVTHIELWRELRGIACYKVGVDAQSELKSIRRTQTFKPASNDKAYVFAELSRNIEHACFRARARGLVAQEISFYLKTKDFRYFTKELKLPYPHALSDVMVNQIRPYFELIFSRANLYRTTGIIFTKMRRSGFEQVDLFGNHARIENGRKLYGIIDRLNKKCGEHTVSLASSLKSIQKEKTALHQKRFALLYIGETTIY